MRIEALAEIELKAAYSGGDIAEFEIGSDRSRAWDVLIEQEFAIREGDTFSLTERGRKRAIECLSGGPCLPCDLLQGDLGIFGLDLKK